MKWCVVVLMMLMAHTHAGMRKQEPLPDITAEANAYDAAGEIQLQPLIDLEVGQTIGFRVGTHVEVAVVERHVANAQHLLITGKFLKHHDAEFVFEFERLPGGATHITALLLFVDLGRYYTLESDTRGKMCFVEHNINEPETSTVVRVP